MRPGSSWETTANRFNRATRINRRHRWPQVLKGGGVRRCGDLFFAHGFQSKLSLGVEHDERVDERIECRSRSGGAYGNADSSSSCLSSLDDVLLVAGLGIWVCHCPYQGGAGEDPHEF